MFPASAIPGSSRDDELHDATNGHPPSRRRGAVTTGAGGPAAPPTAGPVVAAESPAESGERDGGPVRVDTEPGAPRRRRRLRSVAVGVTLVVAIGASLVLGLRTISETDRADRYQEQLDAATTRVDQLVAESSEQRSLISSLEGRLSEMKDRVAEIKDSKVRTVVKTRTVTETVRRWVPNGKGIEVDTTGFDDQIAIHDVQLTRAYGYSHLIGIAVNESGQTISYTQLGCTFVDGEGRLLANEMVNKAGWAPGQSWGFDCSAQVDATGGIVRVDEMT